MNKSLLSEIELVCPRCRKLEHGRLTHNSLHLQDNLVTQCSYVLNGFLVCDYCQSKYPIVDGVPIILKDFNAWWKNQNHAVLPKTNVDLNLVHESINEKIIQLLEDPQDSAYMDNHYGEFTNYKVPLPLANNKAYWRYVLELIGNHSVKSALDLGCGVGRFTFELAKKAKLAVGLDMNYAFVHEASRIQRNHGCLEYFVKVRTLKKEIVHGKFAAPDNVLFLVGDALDPPFVMESFGIVSALNLIDSIAVPLILLGQIDALLRPGGTMILGSPYTWRTEVADPVEWLETQTKDAPTLIKGILTGKSHTHCGFNYKIEKEIENVVWSLRNSNASISVFIVDLLKAIKKAGLN